MSTLELEHIKHADLASGNNISLTSAGNVGIGTVSPTSPLHITGSGHTALTITGGAGSDAQIRFGDSANTTIGMINYDNAIDALKFVVNGSTAAIIDNGGRAIIVGGVTLGNGSTYAAANTLDDYEEGTWAPAFAGYTGTQPTIGSTQYHGTYTKIGNLVTLSAFLHAGSISGNTSEILVITGLPFDMATTGHVSGSHTSQNLNFLRPPVSSGLTGVVGGKLAFLTAVNNGAWGWEKVSILGTSGYIDCDVRMTVTYRTT